MTGGGGQLPRVHFFITRDEDIPVKGDGIMFATRLGFSSDQKNMALRWLDFDWILSFLFSPSFWAFFNHKIPPFSGQQAKSGGQAGKRHGVSYHYHAAGG